MTSRFATVAADTQPVADAFLRELEPSPYLQNGTNATQITGLMQQDPATGTFTFEAKLKLKRPIRL